MAVNTPTRSTIGLDKAARQVPATTVNATTKLLQAVAKHSEGTAFVTHMLNVLTQVATNVDARQLDAAESDYAALVHFLEQPEVLSALRREDPLISARLRGFQMRERLLALEGGACSTKEMAETLGVTRQAIDKRRKNGTLIGVDLGKRGYLYPVWQIGLEGLDSVLAELQGYDPWTQLAFMLTPNTWLDGQVPLTLLRNGEIKRVVEAAHVYGEQIAT